MTLNDRIMQMTQMERDNLIYWFLNNRPSVLREGMRTLGFLGKKLDSPPAHGVESET